MLPCSSEITILRKQNRKGSDVSRNRITWKQKPPRLALFQKLELPMFEEGPVFFGFRGKSFSYHTWIHHTLCFFHFTLLNCKTWFYIWCYCQCKMRWRKKQVVEIVSQIRLDLEEIGAKVTQINIYQMTIEQTDQIASPRIILNLHLSYGRYCVGRLIAIAILVKKISGHSLLLLFLLTLFFLQVLSLEMFRITPFPLSEDVYIAKCQQTLSLKKSCKKYKPLEPKYCKAIWRWWP